MTTEGGNHEMVDFEKRLRSLEMAQAIMQQTLGRLTEEQHTANASLTRIEEKQDKAALAAERAEGERAEANRQALTRRWWVGMIFSAAVTFAIWNATKFVQDVERRLPPKEHSVEQ